MVRPAGSPRLLRELNESAALGHLLERGQLTRGELRELTGLSKPTASEMLRRLEQAGLAMVAGVASGGPGPNATVYAANPRAGYAAAVSVREVPEVRGRRRPALEAVLLDLAGEPRARVTDSGTRPETADPEESVVTAVLSLCRKARVARSRLLHVRLGVPGSYDEAADRVHHIDVPAWSRPGLLGAIRRRLDTEVVADNDANLAAIAERGAGSAPAETGFALLWLGVEGLGLAVDLGDRLLRGARGGAGEIGYAPVAISGRRQREDFQDLVGGPAVLALAHELGIAADSPDQAVGSAVATATGDATVATTAGVATNAGVATAVAPDGPGAAARRFLNLLGERIALGLAAVVAVLDPPLIVLSGEVGQAGGAWLADTVSTGLRSVLASDTVVVPTGVTDPDPVLLGARHAALTASRERLLATLATR